MSVFGTIFVSIHLLPVMRKVLIISLFLITTLFAWANDGAFYTEGTHLIPISETDISVQKEVLTLNRVGDKIEVTVYYEFFNPTAQKELLVGFEAAAPDVDFNGQSVKQFPQHPYMSNFKVVMNGEPLSYEIAHVSLYDHNWNYLGDPKYYVDGQIKSATPKELCLEKWLTDGDDEAVGHPLYVYHFKALFRPGLNIIQHTYDFDMSDERNGFTKVFYYILTAANRWANNQIDDFTLYVNMGDHTSFHISPSFFKSADEWEIQGTGKYTIGTIPYQVKPDSIFFHMQHGNIRFHKENFHPDGELRIEQDLTWGPWTWHIRKERNVSSFDTQSFVNSYKLQYEHILLYAPVEKEDTYFDEFTLEQCRILKSIPFAYRGYVFKNKELQDFYESTVWYIPNPQYKADMKDLSEDEKRWVDFWAISDSVLDSKKKQIEERVNSMYKHVFSEYLKPGHDIPTTNFDSIYYSKEFYRLDRMIGSIENQLKEPIIHDADYWIQGQDWCDDLSARIVNIEMVSGKKALVTMNIHNCQDSKETLVMVYERNNWFIDDMTEGVSMRQTILNDLDHYKKEGIEPRIK